MPSILIETGFLTNPEDERLMVTDKGQLKIAESIYRAFRKYKGDLDDVKINEGKRDELKQDNKLEEKPKDNLYKETNFQ